MDSKTAEERWIADQFAKIVNRQWAADFSVHQRADREAPGPDWILRNTEGQEVGVEVTELFEDPSELTGAQDAGLFKLSKELKEALNGLDCDVPISLDASSPIRTEEALAAAQDLAGQIRARIQAGEKQAELEFHVSSHGVTARPRPQ